MYKFRDVDGNVFIWWTSSSLNLDHVLTVTGTVSEHSEYEGVKQTLLKRCKLTYESADKLMDKAMEELVKAHPENLVKGFDLAVIDVIDG